MEFLKLFIILLLFFDQKLYAAEFEYENCLENNPMVDEEFDFIVGMFISIYLRSTIRRTEKVEK